MSDRCSSTLKQKFPNKSSTTNTWTKCYRKQNLEHKFMATQRRPVDILNMYELIRGVVLKIT